MCARTFSTFVITIFPEPFTYQLQIPILIQFDSFLSLTSPSSKRHTKQYILSLSMEYSNHSWASLASYQAGLKDRVPWLNFRLGKVQLRGWVGPLTTISYLCTTLTGTGRLLGNTPPVLVELERPLNKGTEGAVAPLDEESEGAVGTLDERIKPAVAPLIESTDSSLSSVTKYVLISMSYIAPLSSNATLPAN